MKVKGISFFEQHVEKFVLLGALAIGLFFAAMQFIGPGKRVEVDGQQIGADRIDTVLERKARVIQERLSETAPPNVSPPQAQSVAAWFDEHLSASVSRSALAQLPYVKPHIRGTDLPEIDQHFIVPTLAGAGRPWVDQHADAIENREDLGEGVLAAVRFPNPGTSDIVWTTPAFMLDLDALRSQLKEDDASGERLSVPPNWYDNRIYVLDVVFEREERLPDGQWGNRTIVPTMPDFVEHRERVNNSPRFTAGGMNALLEWLRTDPGHNQASIIQPEFHLTKSSLWAPPQEPAEVDERNPAIVQVMDLKSRIQFYERQIASKTATLNELGGPLDEMPGGPRSPTPPPGGGGRGGGGPGIPGGGGGGGLDPGGGDAQSESRDRRTNIARIRLTGQIRQLQARLAEMRPQLEALAREHGIMLDDFAAERRVPDLQRDPSVLVWGHDLTVEPGKTYRYRATVRLYNPFFGKVLFLVDEQKHLADAAAMDVAPSEWSTPVTVKSLTRYFITSARTDDPALGMGSARFEIFRLHDGIWHMREWVLYPGDPVGDVERGRDAEGNAFEIDFIADGFVQDILRVPDDISAAGGPVSQSRDGRVVIVQSDGTVVIREPARDLMDSERLRLLTQTEGAGRRTALR